ISTLLCGPHGGNMDLPCVRPGATLHLPVFVEGALLMMGDIHAAQGHGEIIGGGVETSGKIACNIRLIQSKRSIERPPPPDANSLVAIATADPLRGAIEQAYADLLDWLAIDLAMNRWDAYHLISQAGAVQIGGLVQPPNPQAAAASLPIAVLPERARGMLVESER